MKKYTLILFILIFALGFLGLFNLNVNSASAVNCASGDLFNTTTSLPCGGATGTGRKLSCVNLFSSIYCSYTSDTLVTAVPPIPLPPTPPPTPTPPSVASSCTLAGSVKEFNPFPLSSSDAGWSSYGAYIGIGGRPSVYQPPSSGPRLLIGNSFGYLVVDITNRGNPTSLGYEDYRWGMAADAPIPCGGDCHGTMGTAGISADGERVAFSVSSLAAGSSSLQTRVGQPSANGWGFTLKGDMAPAVADGVLLQRAGSNYFAYTFARDGVRVADATTLPGLNPDAPNNLKPVLAPSLPAGYGATLSGYWITYMSLDQKSAYLVNATNPLPATALTAKQFTAADFGRSSSDNFAGVSVAQDPTNPAAVYLLSGFTTTTPAHYTSDGKGYVQATLTYTGYTLIRVQGGVPTIVGSLNLGTGETNFGAPSLSADSAGNLFAFMGAMTSGGVYREYTSSVREFGGKFGFFDNTTGLPSAFVAGTVPGQIYGYSAGGVTGHVFPMTCGTSTTSYTPPPLPPTPPPTPPPAPYSCTTGASLGLPACTNGCYVPQPGPSGGGPSDYYKCVPNGFFTQLLKLGSSGSEVIALQELLIKAGYDVGTADGKFGPKTQAAVIKFQIANGLVGDGVVGAQTRALLNNPPSATQACTLNISYNPTTVPYNGSLTVSYSGTNIDNSTVQYNFDNKGYAPLSPFPDSKVQSNLTNVGTHNIILQGKNSAGATCYSNTPSYTVSPATAGTCTFSPPAGLSPCTNGCYVPQPGPSGGGPLDYWKCVPN